MSSLNSPILASGKIQFREDIEGLRGVAVILVLLAHLHLSFSGGYIGVDVFFVISGYLITSIIVHDLATQTFSFLRFWERRIRRIVPAIAVVCLGSTVAAWLLQLPVDLIEYGQSLAAVVLGVSNVSFWMATGYFESEAALKPLLHTWSLAVEEQFYLFFPFGFVLCYRNRSGLLKSGIVICLIGSLSASVYGAYYHPSATYYLLPTRAWELLAGSFIAIHGVTPLRSGWLRRFVRLASLACIVVPALLYNENTPFPGVAAIPPVLGAALIIAFGGNDCCILSNRLLRFVGRISYSLYLWHWPIIVFSTILSPAELTITDRVILLAISILAAYLCWRLVEVPFRNANFLKGRREVFVAAAITVGLLLSTGLTLSVQGGFPSRLSAPSRVFLETCSKDERLFRSITPEDFPQNLLKLGPVREPADIFVFGDSHAAAILPAIEAVCRDKDLACVAATHGATAPTIGYFLEHEFGLNEDTEAFCLAAIQFIKEQRIPIVVLAARWELYWSEGSTEFQNAFLSTVDVLIRNGARVVFVKDVPALPMLPQDVILLPGRSSGVTVSLAAYRDANRCQEMLVPSLLKMGVEVLDPLPHLQEGDSSTAVVPFDENGSFYCDGNHLSTYGALKLTGMFSSVFGTGDSN